MAVDNFFNDLKALYWANDGDFAPSSPMKMYHGFMIDKMNEATSSKLKKVIWHIIHVVTGIFAYPILGFLAGLDIAVKRLNWQLNGKQHYEMISIFKCVFSNVHGEPANGRSLSFRLTSNESLVTPILKNFREYDIKFGPETVLGQFDGEKRRLAEEMTTLLERVSNIYTKVYIQYSGSWEHGMKFSFFAADSILPYCSNPLLPYYKKITYPPQQIFQYSE